VILFTPIRRLPWELLLRCEVRDLNHKWLNLILYQLNGIYRKLKIQQVIK